MFLLKKEMLLSATGIILLIFSLPSLAAGKLNILNWSHYIAPNTIENFSKEYGIEVSYNLMDSNEILEAKLLAGNSGYDVIFPSLHVLKRLSDAGLITKLDKSRLTNYHNLDERKLAKIAEIDKDNSYGIPYLELSTGLGLNPELAAKALGTTEIPASFDLLFKPEYASKLAQCGIAVLDSPSDMICSALLYLGLDPESDRREDYRKAQELLASAMPYITYIHSSQYTNDLASGDICLAVGWSGDVQLSSLRRQEAGLSPLRYIIPKEGALMGYDMVAIPEDSKNKDNAYLFLDYLMRPEVIADISNYMNYANANAASTPLIKQEILDNPGIYYNDKTLERMQIVVPSPKLSRLMTRTWNNIRTQAAD